MTSTSHLFLSTVTFLCQLHEMRERPEYLILTLHCSVLLGDYMPPYLCTRQYPHIDIGQFGMQYGIEMIILHILNQGMPYCTELNGTGHTLPVWYWYGVYLTRVRGAYHLSVHQTGPISSQGGTTMGPGTEMAYLVPILDGSSECRS